MTKQQVRVDSLQTGMPVLGTGASGEFPEGPRLLSSITEAPEHSKRTTAYRVLWDDGGWNVYYGDTLVIVGAAS